MFDDDEREQMPLEARAIHQRLLNDSNQWVRKLPSDASVAEFARTLPRRMPSPSARSTHNVLAHRRPSSTLPDMMSVKGQPYMPKFDGPRRTIAASFAAVVVVALIAGVLYSLNSGHGTRAASGGGPGTSTAVVPTLSQTPLPTPGPLDLTPGPQAKYIANIVTARGRSSDGTPTQITSYFQAGDWVYVVATVHGLPNGTHVISIVWYLNGHNAELTPSTATSLTISGDKRVVFGLQYPKAGVGMARLYIDRPASDTSDSPSDPYLAYTVKFIVAPNGNPNPTPTEFVPPTPTPFALPTATPHP